MIVSCKINTYFCIFHLSAHSWKNINSISWNVTNVGNNITNYHLFKLTVPVGIDDSN